MTPSAILFVVDHLNGGGAEHMTLRLAQAMVKQNIKVGIIILSDQKSRLVVPHGVEKFVLDAPLDMIYQNLWKPKYYPLDAQQQLQAMIDQFCPDVLVLGFWNGHWVNQFVQAKKIVHWVHGDMLDLKISAQWSKKLRDYLRTLRYPQVFKKLFQTSNMIIVNQDLADRYQRLIPQATIRVVANGVDATGLITPDTTVIDKHWDVVFVGRFSPEKQPDHALRAFASSKLTGRFAMVGDGSMKTSLLALAKSLGIEDRVDFLGWLSQPADVMLHSRCLVLSSRTEGSPLVSAEALTLGVPVVAYDCCSGISDQLASPDLKRGLVPIQHLDTLAATLYDVVQSPYHISDQDKQRLSMDYMVGAFMQALQDI